MKTFGVQFNFDRTRYIREASRSQVLAWSMEPHYPFATMKAAQKWADTLNDCFGARSAFVISPVTA